MGNWLGLGSAWVSGQMIFSGYTANNYPRSTFDLVVILPYKKQKNDCKETIRFAACDVHDALNFPPNTTRSKVDLG